MILTQLGIRNFRIVDELTLSAHSRLNLIQGNNGSGKSSVLEAIQCLATGHTFRTRQPKELVAFENESFSINAVFVNPSSQQEHRAGLEKSRNGAATLRLNYEDIKTQSEIAQLLPVKILTPDSHFLIQQGPDERRSFLDWGLFHVEESFLPQWKIYKRALSQRNQLLKAHARSDDIRAWHHLLASSGDNLSRYRHEYIASLAEIVTRRLKEMAVVFHVELRFRQGWSNDESFESVLETNLETHRKMRTTTDGPHRADIQILCDGIRAKQVLSRGQQKVLIYALHLSQLELLNKNTGKQSIVLCDDLISELDDDNTAAILEQICSGIHQTFVTGTSLDALADRPNHMFHMEHGVCRNRL